MKKIIRFLLILITAPCFGQELCDNAIDDDGDGLTDLNDPDCACSTTPVPSIIPNASFEDYSTCPWDYSQLDLCTGWVQASVPTTDYFNTCGYVFPGILSAGMMPFPDGNGAAGGIIQPGYREYLGSCLSAPMLAGTSYRLTFSLASFSANSDGSMCNGGVINYEPIPITLYGNTNCSQLPVIDAWLNPNATDPTWFVVGSAYYVPSNSWQELTIVFTPTQNINTIILGAPEDVPDSYESTCYPYFLYDNLLLNNSAAFGVTVIQNGSYCENNLSLEAVLTVPVSGTAAYQWYKDGVAMAGETNPVVSIPSVPANLSDYMVRVTENDGCTTSNTLTIYSTIPAPEFTYILPTCVTLTGSITITTPAAFYSFDNGVTWLNSPTLGNLQPGQYLVRTKSANSCISSPAIVNLTMPIVNDHPEYTLGYITCTYGGDITITSPAYEYSFDGGVTWQQSNVLLNPQLDIVYELVMRSSDGCTSNSNYTYASTDGIMPYPPDVTVTQPSSCAAQTGTVFIVSWESSYSYNNGATWTTNNSAQLSPGTHIIRVRDATGCMSPPVTVIINAPADAPTAPQFTVVDPTCTVPTGTITITSTGAQYSFDNGTTWGTNNSMANFAPGTYSLKVKNADGCQSDPTVAVVSSETGPPSAPAITVNQPDCFSPTGVITITSPAMEYSFDNGVTWGNTNISPALVPGNYSIKIKNAAGCESPAVLVLITPDVVPAPTVADIIYCKDTTPAALTAIGSGLKWYSTATGGTATTIAPMPSATLPGIAAYYVTQTLNGCESDRAQINVEIIDRLDPPVAANVVYCQNDTPTALMAAGQNLLWYTAPTGGSGSATAPVPVTSQPGTFTFYVSQSAYGCESERTEITVTVYPTPPTPLTEEHIVYQHYKPSEALSAIGSNLTWYDEDKNPLAAAPVPPTGMMKQYVYYVSQTVSGCESGLVKIIVDIIPNYAVIDYPKFFSPNNDGLHDTWNIRPIPNGIRASIYIFDRYGRVLAKVYSPGPGWDGNYNGKAIPATDYWFRATYTEYGVEKEFHAHFSLLR